MSTRRSARACPSPIRARSATQSPFLLWIPARVEHVHAKALRPVRVGTASSTMSGGLQAALFDLDGLLVDSEPLWHEAEIGVLGSYGVPLTVEMCRQTKGRYVSEAVQHWHDRYPWQPT